MQTKVSIICYRAKIQLRRFDQSVQHGKDVGTVRGEIGYCYLPKTKQILTLLGRRVGADGGSGERTRP